MPIVTVDIVPDLMDGDRGAQYEEIARGITDAIVSSTGAPQHSVHVLVNEVTHDKYAVGGVMLRDATASAPAPGQDGR